MFQISGTDHHQLLAVELELARIATNIPDAPVAENVVKTWVMRGAATCKGEDGRIRLVAFGGITASIPKPEGGSINDAMRALLSAWLPVAQAELSSRRAALIAQQTATRKARP